MPTAHIHSIAPGSTSLGTPKTPTDVEVMPPDGTLSNSVPKISKSSRKTIRCAACQNDTASLRTGLIEAPCNHHYCNDCIVDLFRAATSDETLMPPRCCRMEIPLRLVDRLLSPKESATFVAKSIEFATANRIYCPKPNCSRFIGEASKQKGTSVECPNPRCGIQICSFCKTEQHPSWEDCSDDKDEASKLALALGNKEGWRRCGECRQLIELVVGW